MLESKNNPQVERVPIIEQLTQIGREQTAVTFENTALSPDCEK